LRRTGSAARRGLSSFQEGKGIRPVFGSFRCAAKQSAFSDRAVALAMARLKCEWFLPRCWPTRLPARRRSRRRCMNLPPHESRIKLPSATAAGLIGRDQVWFELAPAELIITMAEQKGRIEREPFFQEGRAGHLLGRLERKCTYGGVGGDLQVLPQSRSEDESRAAASFGGDPETIEPLPPLGRSDEPSSVPSLQSCPIPQESPNRFGSSEMHSSVQYSW